MATQTRTQEQTMAVERLELADHPYPRVRHEIPKFVPKVEVRELVREVPEFEIEWTERIVTVPDIEVREVYEEVEQTKEVIRHVPKIETVEVPYEEIEYRRRIEEKIVEKVVEVHSKTNIIEVAQESIEYVPHVVPYFHDREVPVVVNETIQPIVQETEEVLEVPVYKYIPHLVPVDIYVPRPVNVEVTRNKSADTTEIVQTAPLPPETIRNLLLEMNPHIKQMEEFNEQQLATLKESHARSVAVAHRHGFQAPPPLDEAALHRRIQAAYDAPVRQNSPRNRQPASPRMLNHANSTVAQAQIHANTHAIHKMDNMHGTSNDGSMYKTQNDNMVINQPTIGDSPNAIANPGQITPGKSEYHRSESELKKSFYNSGSAEYVLPAKRKQ